MNLAVMAGEASMNPSRATVTACAQPVWTVRIWTAAPSTGSQTRTAPSLPAEASQDPSGATANAPTPWVASEDMTAGAGDRIGSVIVSPVDYP
jgi:hypothetical protein